MSLPKSRFGVTLTGNNEKRATFYFQVYKNNNDEFEQLSPVYCCFNQIYITFKMNFFMNSSLVFCIKSVMYGNDIRDCQKRNSLKLVFARLYNMQDEGSERKPLNSLTFTTGTVWHSIYDGNCTNESITNYMITIKLLEENETAKSVKECAFLGIMQKLYEDKEFVDIELREEDKENDAGSGVSFHRNVLANSSKVLSRMVSSDWREAKEGIVLLPASNDTLQHFKDYIYLRELPHDGAKCSRLLVLANYFMMPDLATACANIMAAYFQPEATFNWLENCILTQNFDQLKILMTSCTQDQIDKMADFFNRSLKLNHNTLQNGANICCAI